MYITRSVPGCLSFGRGGAFTIHWCALTVSRWYGLKFLLVIAMILGRFSKVNAPRLQFAPALTSMNRRHILPQIFLR